MATVSMKKSLPGLRLLGNRILVTVLDDPDKVGLLYLPEVQRHITRLRGTIRQIGPGVSPDHKLKVGHVVHLRRELGYIKVLIKDVEHAIVPFECVLGFETSK